MESPRLPLNGDHGSPFARLLVHCSGARRLVGPLADMIQQVAGREHVWSLCLKSGCHCLTNLKHKPCRKRCKVSPTSQHAPS